MAFPDIATFNGDFQAWADANLAASAKKRAQLEAEKVTSTQEMIDPVAVQREIDNALEQARRLGQASEPIDNSRMASDVYAISTAMADATSTFLTIAELLGFIAINTRTGGGSSDGNNSNANGQPTQPGIEGGSSALDLVKETIEQSKTNPGITSVLDPIVTETKTDKPFANPLSEIFPTGRSEFPDLISPPTPFSNIDLPSDNTPLNPFFNNPSPGSSAPDTPFPEFNLPGSSAPVPGNIPTSTNQQSALPPTTRVSAILNPTIQNSVTPRFAAPAVNVSTVAQRDPGYFYRNLANEVSPQVAYRVPPGVQATQGATSYQPATQNTTINITNKIDAASQREMYAKIGETQTKAVLSALNKMA